MSTTRDLLRNLPEPDDRAATRVRRRVRATLAERAEPRRGWVPWTLAGACAAAAVALVVLRPPPPQPLDLEIASEQASQAITLSEHVRLAAQGRGHAAGTDRAPRVQWDQGSLSVDVDPGQGVDLMVSTDEATVRVVGTSFVVERSALGTQVSVQRGVVQVNCASGSESRLTAGDGVECVPVRPPTLLGRARALSARGDPPEAVLEALDAAERPDNPAALAGEILALRVDTLRHAGRDAEALAAAQRYLDAGYTPRRQEVRRIAASLSFARGGCAEALPLLREAAADGGAPEDTQALAACEARLER